LKTLTRFIIASTTLVLLNTSAFAQTVEEVTVTAARQEQSVQDVAISVQAITSEDLQLQHIETADDLASTVPGFDFTEALGSGVLLKIRGLSFATIGAAGTQPAVTAQNGHQIGNRPFSTIGFYDADRIEILEGPQGTLYGRNSTTGLVNFITAKPGADQYVTLTAGADGLAQVKFATDFELSDSTVMRIAGTKLDIDPVVLNTGTGNGVDDRDSYGIRTTIETAMDERNTLTFQLEKTAVNDNRLNYGLSACNRDAFFGCNPLTQDFSPHLNRPTMSSGTIANQFNLLTNINNDNLDLFADTDASRVNSIDQINKDIDSQRKDNFEMASLTNVSELDNMTVTLKATYIDQDYYHLDDNDHSNATVGLNGALAPPTGLVIPELRTYCLGTMTNVANDFAVECSQVDTQSKQFEINLVSDFDGPFNFVAGAYNYQDNSRNQYSIQTAAYVLLNDFDQHPYSQLFGTYAPTMNTYGGQAFFTNFGGTLAQLANPASALVDGNGNNAVAATTAAVQAALAADATIAAAVGAGTLI
jgi:outer membrane receptor protein involved in Fe transport